MKPFSFKPLFRRVNHHHDTSQLFEKGSRRNLKSNFGAFNTQWKLVSNWNPSLKYLSTFHFLMKTAEIFCGVNLDVKAIGNYFLRSLEKDPPNSCDLKLAFFQSFDLDKFVSAFAVSQFDFPFKILVALITPLRLEVCHFKVYTWTKLFLQQPHNSISVKWVTK